MSKIFDYYLPTWQGGKGGHGSVGFPMDMKSRKIEATKLPPKKKVTKPRKKSPTTLLAQLSEIVSWLG